MRYLAVLFLFSLLLSACAGSKEIEFGTLNQAPCRNEAQLNNPNEFIGETVENLNVYQQGDQIFAAMDVRTYCDARLSFDVETKEGQIKLKLKNNNTNKDDCVCFVNLTTSLKNVEAGDYNIMVTNSTGSQLHQQTNFSVK